MSEFVVTVHRNFTTAEQDKLAAASAGGLGPAFTGYRGENTEAGDTIATIHVTAETDEQARDRVVDVLELSGAEAAQVQVRPGR